jgi:hypothetical protein
LQLIILYDKVPEMKLRPVIQFNQTCRASLPRIENENSSSAWWEIPWLPNFLITGHPTGLMVLLSSMQFKVKKYKVTVGPINNGQPGGRLRQMAQFNSRVSKVSQPDRRKINHA